MNHAAALVARPVRLSGGGRRAGRVAATGITGLVFEACGAERQLKCADATVTILFGSTHAACASDGRIRLARPADAIHVFVAEFAAETGTPDTWGPHAGTTDACKAISRVTVAPHGDVRRRRVERGLTLDLRTFVTFVTGSTARFA